MSTKYIASNWRLPNKAGVDSYLNDNYGVTFDGSEHIDCGEDLGNFFGSYNGVISFSMWINPTSNNSNNGFFQIGNTTGEGLLNLRFGVFGSNFWLYIKTNGSNQTRTFDLTSLQNTWIHVAGVWDLSNSGNSKLYLNGSEYTTEQTNWATGTLNFSSQKTFIGLYFSTSNSFDGSISEVAIFDYALSSTQISTLYGSSSLGAGNPMALKPAPVAFYPLGDNSSGNPLTQPNEAVEYASVFNFDGSSEYVEAGLIDITSNKTLSIWFKSDSISSNQGLFEIMPDPNTSDFLIVWIYNSKILVSANGVASDSKESSVLNSNTWYNLIITKSSGIIDNIYINGLNDTQSTTNTLGFVGGRGNTYIGATYQGTVYANEFNGKLSNVAIWNSDQSSEISNIYNSGVPATTYTNTPTAWYKLDQSANWDVSGSGYWDIPDASGNGNDGISSGMTSANLVLTDLTRNLPYDSYSFNFDGANDYIDCGIPSFLNSTSVFSSSLWFNTNDVGTQTTLWAVGSSASQLWAVSKFEDDLIIYGGTSTKYYRKNNLFSINTWYNLIVVYDGSQSNADRFKVYLNGVLLTGATINETIETITPTFTTNFNIGRIGYAAASYFNGKISNVSIFDEALTSTEVLKLYSNGMPQDLLSFTPAPIAWWTLGSNSFFNGSNFICKDLIGSNDGTSANAGVDALQGNTPRSEANGTGTNQSIPENLEGTTKYSSNNSWSINMSESARVADTP